VQQAQQTVLVIDDDLDFLQFVSVVIEGAGCPCVIATSGADGLRLAREFAPALILCDLLMPGEINGMDVMQQLKADPMLSDIPRVLMSGHGCPDLRIIPADAFIAKPIDTQSLRRVVRAFTRPQAVTAS
jgi:CheY-like chemotaxis protein